jgi:glycosyltransferase involved in cell wall biosynthesis
MLPLVSICIPAFKQGTFINRLLKSIYSQDVSDFEVIVTDDSPGDEVYSVIQNWINDPRLKYYRNSQRLGSPKNWNAALGKAKGKWIKMMHHDDWFNGTNSLSQFVITAENIGKSAFVISQSNACNIDGIVQYVHYPPHNTCELLLDPERSLLASNYIGCPSATLFYNDRNITFDEKLIWVVDVDAYMRIAKRMTSALINNPLINVSLAEGDHVTSTISKNKPLMLSEVCYLFDKVDSKSHAVFFRHLQDQTVSMSFQEIKITIQSPLSLSKTVKILIVFGYILSRFRAMIFNIFKYQ